MSGEYMENENEFRTVIRADGTVGIIPSLNSVMRSCDADGVVDMDAEGTWAHNYKAERDEFAERLEAAIKEIDRKNVAMGSMIRELADLRAQVDTLNRIAADEMVLRATCETQAKMLRNAETDMRRMHERIDILETREVEQTEYTEQLERDYTAARAAACAWKQAAKTYRSEYKSEQ